MFLAVVIVKGYCRSGFLSWKRKKLHITVGAFTALLWQNLHSHPWFPRTTSWRFYYKINKYPIQVEVMRQIILLISRKVFIQKFSNLCYWCPLFLGPIIPQISERLLCEDCGKEFLESYLHNHFDAFVCDLCRWASSSSFRN